MKKLFAFLLLFYTATCVSASPRNVDSARNEASRFLVSISPSKAKRMSANPSLSLAHIVTQKTTNTPAAYVFQDDVDNGFVIVSAEDVCTNILGYSAQGKFDANNIPANLQVWLQHYAEEIEWAANQPQTPLSRRAIANVSQTSGRSISPLLNGIQWGQDEPFNNLCPIDSDNERSVTGCVATAAAQIMAYWKYPTQGTGNHSYTWKCSNGTTKTLSADFGTTTYDWGNMSPSYGRTYSQSQANAVATLMYHAGIACEMEYSSAGSAASTTDMTIAMQTYFGYDHAMSCYNADYEGFEILAEKIQEELEAGRPVMMDGATERNEGHCFVCEGSDGNGNFYFNWGWDGSCDGYYPLTALQPTEQGIGGASSGLAFTVRVAAYTGIQPNQGGIATPIIKIGAESVTMNNATIITKGSQLKFSLEKLMNIGLTNWAGNVAMAIYDNDNNYVGKIQNSTSYSLSPSYYYTSALIISGYLPQLADGRYVLIPAYTISEESGIFKMPIKSATKQFSFSIIGNVVNFNASDAVDQKEKYTIIFKDSDTSSDSDTQFTTSNSTLNSFIQQSDISISSYACDHIYLAKDNYGLKFGSRSKDGFLTLNFGKDIIVDSINIVIGGYNDTERNFILQSTLLTNIHKASAGFETRTVKLDGARLNAITLQSTMRAYVKSLTIFTTDQETAQASFEFTGGEAYDYTSIGDGTNAIVYLTTNDYVEDKVSSSALTGTCLALDLGTLNPYSIIGTYVFGDNSLYTPGLLNKKYSYLSYGDEWYEIEGGVLSIINNNRNEFEFSYDIQVSDGKSYTGTVILPIASLPLSIYSNNGYDAATWQFEPIVARNVNQTNTEIANLTPNTPTIHTYLVEGIVSQLDAVGINNVAQFYISQNGTTNQQICCYNARYLNNTAFVEEELTLGDTVVMFAKLEKYNGVNELLGYVFQHRPYVDLSRYTPYNLVVEPKIGSLDFSWNCEVANQYELEIIQVSDGKTWTFYCKNTFTTITYSGAINEFAWRVRSLDENGVPVSDWVNGENFISLDNPYQPSELHALTTGDGHFVFTWTADSIVDSYVVKITLDGNVYAELTVSEPIATTDIAISDTYGWTVYAFDADGNQLGYASGKNFEVSNLTDYSIKNLTTIVNGFAISATWDSPAPIFDVRVLDTNGEQVYAQKVYGNSTQYTVSATGTYTVFVRPANVEYTFYLADWSSSTITVSGETSSTQSYQLTLHAMTGGSVNMSAARTYTYGSVVDIEAIANPNYRFLKWSDENTNARRSVIMTQDISLTAYFYEIETTSLTITNAVGGYVSLPVGEYIYAKDATEIVYAIADAGYKFAYWKISGQMDTNPSNPLVITMSNDIAITPVFVLSDVSTDVEEAVKPIKPKSVKKIIDNQVVIIHSKYIYNVTGQKIR